MKAIWKYEFSIKDKFDIGMPYGADILDIQMQDEVPCIWAIVEPKNMSIPRHFRILGTGHLFDKETDKYRLIYVGTIHMPPFVWHLFEEIPYED
jgi:hypothetical protein